MLKICNTPCHAVEGRCPRRSRQAYKLLDVCRSLRGKAAISGLRAACGGCRGASQKSHLSLRKCDGEQCKPRGVCNCTSGFALQTDGHCPSSGPPKRACGRRAPWPPRHENKSLGPARGTTPQSPAVTAPLKGEPKHIAEFPVKFIMASTTRPRNGQDRSLQSSLYCVVDIKLTCRAGCPHPAATSSYCIL